MVIEFKLNIFPFPHQIMTTKPITRRSLKGRKKTFLPASSIQEILELNAQDVDEETIAKQFNITVRHTRDIIRNNSPTINKEFTMEEDQLLIDKYTREHISRPSELCRFFKNKTLYMIRNRLRLLRKEGKLDSVYLPPDFITHETQPLESFIGLESKSILSYVKFDDSYEPLMPWIE